jgi:hypothetical protein
MILTQLFYGCGDGVCVHIKSFQCGADVVYRVWLVGLPLISKSLILQEFFSKKISKCDSV